MFSAPQSSLARDVVVPSDWVAFARRSHLDSDMVLDVIRRVDEGFLEHVEGTLADTELGNVRRDEIDKLVQRAERSIRLNPVP